MLTSRMPCANQANGMTLPQSRSEGWWQPLIGGCGLPSRIQPGHLEGRNRHRQLLDVMS